MRVYQDAVDGLRGTGLLAVCSPVQRNLPFIVWDADVGVVFDQEADVFGSVIKGRPVQSSLLKQREWKKDKNRIE